MPHIQEIVQHKSSNPHFKKNNVLFNELVNAFLSTKSVISAKNRILNDTDLMNFIDYEIPQLKDFDIYTKLNWILSGRTDFPRCHYCNEILPKLKIPVFEQYSNWCCVKHMCNDQLYKKLLQDAFEKKYGPGIKSNFQIPGMKEKIEKTWKQKYGTTNPFALNEIKQKRKNTCIARYGVDNNMKSEEGMTQYRKSMQEKHGVDYAWQITEVIEKSQQTSMKKYGILIASQSEQAKVKQAETNNERYGGKSPICSEEVKIKSKSTCLERYGVEHPMQNSEIRKKQQKRYHVVIFEKYGVQWPSQAEEIKDKIHRAGSKKLSYHEVQFDSAPELAFYIWLTDNKIQFDYQPNISFQFQFDGETHQYFPDFKVNDQLVEIKGDHFLKEDGTWQNPYDSSLNDLYEAKHQCALANNVHIMYAAQYQQYLDYVDQKYGKGYLTQFKSRPDM